ncbi:amidase [uncultured Ruegeria sp.]|uniref:amidase n=1 Tax=uncultured Ruegeria sp. TaxID=259304 RepID=UPI00260A37B9|nr:amidase [uncultured Ruegeria sp.]
MTASVTLTRPGQSLNGWCDYPTVDNVTKKHGPLLGKTLAVKDIFPVKGYPNGWGQPTRLKNAEIDQTTHPEVEKLLEAGAHCIGKSQCEELCYSLMGSNKHYGQPINPNASGRLTGGSSSGSASLVAGGAVDIATASDTAGSIRAPASFCGLVGLRPTHGVLSLDGAMPLAPTFDCFGWYAKDIETYERTADVLLGTKSAFPLYRLYELPAFESALVGDAEIGAFRQGAALVKSHFESVSTLKPLAFTLSDAAQVFTIHQTYEAWQALGPWVTENLPDLDAPIIKRFQYGSSISDDLFRWSVERRAEITDVMANMIGQDGVLLLPTVPSCAPLKSSTADALHSFRDNMLQLLCLSGLSKLPQITLPIAQVHDAPFGISLIGPHGSDGALVSLGRQILGSVRQTG